MLFILIGYDERHNGVDGKVFQADTNDEAIVEADTWADFKARGILPGDAIASWSLFEFREDWGPGTQVLVGVTVNA